MFKATIIKGESVTVEANAEVSADFAVEQAMRIAQKVDAQTVTVTRI